MRIKYSILLVVFVSCLLNPKLTKAQEPKTDSTDIKMEWFKVAKLGIFIHWGIYAVNGIDESWSFYNEYISHEDYLKQTDRFTAEYYDPNKWADLIANSGAKYTVITTRHHDGFSLWPSEYGALNAEEHSAAGRDLLTPFVEAVRKRDLKLGLYYSLPDWSSEDYTHFTKSKKRYQISEDSDRWERFMKYYQGQLGELIDQYNPDLWWFDGDWEHSAEEWRAEETRKMLLDANQDVIINSRMKGNGDYETPEQSVPLSKLESTYWELCITMNDSWGFQGNDLNYKTANEIIRIFADCISLGGNMLLDIGPKADGTIPEEQVDILNELGRWTAKHKEAIYGTESGIPANYYYGPSTLSKDRKTLYLFVSHKPNGPIVVRGLKNKVDRIRVVGNGTKLKSKIHNKPYWSNKAGLLYIDLPEDVLDDQVTVIALQLDGEVSLDK